jgi:nicotinate-nucleotide adenylyltransferase
MGRAVTQSHSGTRDALGILGGTFDPIHIAHLAVAEEARDTLHLRRVLFVPAGIPPHKLTRTITPGEDRLAMVQAAIADDPAFAASRMELDRAGPSWTVDTLEALREEQIAAGDSPDLVLIVSAEAFAGFATWRQPERILELATVAVAPRDGFPDASPAAVSRDFPGLEHRVVLLDGPRLRLSASELRARVAAGRSLRYLVPDAVVAHIEDHALYRDPRRTP